MNLDRNKSDVQRGTVVAVCTDTAHRFSKTKKSAVTLIAGRGIEGDAHAGAFVKHRWLARFQPRAPNLRQVHLIASELFAELDAKGFHVEAGNLGENITTRGIDLLSLPFGARLHVGGTAQVELTGIRTPCKYIEKFQAGLLKAMIVPGADGRKTFRTGVMGIVIEGGRVEPGDPIRVEMTAGMTQPLPAI